MCISNSFYLFGAIKKKIFLKEELIFSILLLLLLLLALPLSTAESLVSQPETEPVSPAVDAPSLTPLTAKEVPILGCFKLFTVITSVYYSVTGFSANMFF